METVLRKSVEKAGGGIVGLAKSVLEYREAIEHDLLVRTGHELNDVGRTLSWGALDSFLQHTTPDSALMKEVNPEVAAWSNTAKTNAILADIYDVLAAINSNLVAVGTRRAAKKPKPYPRPGDKGHDSERHFGSGALPPDELHRWIEEKRAQYAGSRTGNISSRTGS